jgi:hypothetical protein
VARRHPGGAARVRRGRARGLTPAAPTTPEAAHAAAPSPVKGLINSYIHIYLCIAFKLDYARRSETGLDMSCFL